jgi:ABC-type multidrug transport system fused ATPase/permease subunit
MSVLGWIAEQGRQLVAFARFTHDAFLLFRACIPHFTLSLALLIALELLGALSSSLSFAMLAPFLQQLTGTNHEGGPLGAVQRYLGIPPTLVTMAWLLFLGVLVRNVVTIWSTSIQTEMGARLSHRLRADVFAAYVNSDLRAFVKTADGTTISAFTGEIERTKRILSVWRRGISSSLSALTYLGVLLVMAPAVTALFLVAGALLALSLTQFYVRLRHNGLLVSHVMARLNGRVADLLHCFVAIKALGVEDLQHAAFSRDSRQYARLERRQALLTLLPGFVLEAGFYAVVLAVVSWIHGAYIRAGLLNPFTVITYLVFSSRFVEAMLVTSGALSQLFHDAPGFERVRAAVSVRPVQEIVCGERDLAPVAAEIELARVSFFHDGGLVLDDVSLRVPAGQVVAVVGASGAGKTTLALLLAGLYRPDKGEIRIAGTPLSAFTRQSLVRAIAFQPQETRLFSGSIVDNLTFGLRAPADPRRLEAVLAQARLTELVRRRDGQDDAGIGEKGASLSGGERQRILFGRALLRDAPVLVLDEPTSALDLATEAHILKTIADLRGQRTVFFITHRLASARIADRVVVLADGRVAEDGPYDDLLRRDGVLAELSRRER